MRSYSHFVLQYWSLYFLLGCRSTPSRCYQPCSSAIPALYSQRYFCTSMSAVIRCATDINNVSDCHSEFCAACSMPIGQRCCSASIPRVYSCLLRKGPVLQCLSYSRITITRYTESLFAALAFGAMWAQERSGPIATVPFLLLASLTRSNGVPLIAVIGHSTLLKQLQSRHNT